MGIGLTIKDIARRCEVSVSRARYAIDTNGIEPRARVGIIRLWTEDDLPRIKSALRRIAERRGANGG
jgi:DNA-binding transcriptional MerR regulator